VTCSPENRLASYADSNGNSEQFLYSDDGLKKKRVSGSATTLFTYDESALLLETNTSGVVDARYTNAPKTWGVLASQNRSGVSSFYGFDSEQCARILVSIAGLITDSYSYKVFGEPIQGGSGTVNPYRYIANGLYCYELVDLVNAWNNWLKSSVGRWDSRDPIGFDGGDSNLYRYVSNLPTQIVDASGEQSQAGGQPTPSDKFSDCRNRSKAYCNDAYAGCVAGWSNPGANCICRVSTSLCELIKHGPPHMSGLTPRNIQWFNCMNECIFRIWLKPDTSKWNTARQVCADMRKTLSQQPPASQSQKQSAVDACCKAQVGAEQDAYSSCLNPCAKFGPPPTFPQSFPFNGNYGQRLGAAERTCCGGAPGGMPITDPNEPGTLTGDPIPL